MELQPHLTGERIELRPLAAADHDALYAVASDPEIWAQHPVKTRSTPEGFRTFFQESLESGGALVIVDRETGTVIGSSRYHGFDSEKREVEIGWTFLARSHWGGVTNREVKDLMLRHAFRFVDSVLFRVGTGNLRSRRAVEKIGGVRVGEGTDAGGVEGVVYGITAEEFADRSGNATGTPKDVEA
jgi:RimJ/RimL family protein N-acetyltransferase